MWVDDMEIPLMAVPINLSVVLDNFPQGQAILVRKHTHISPRHTHTHLTHYFEHTQGFTSATGRSWEKHDMLSWYFCELVREGKLTTDTAHTHTLTQARLHVLA